MKYICIFLLSLITSISLGADDTFDTLQIFERNKDRIKATGDLRGRVKLMKVIVKLRDNDLLISGNDYRYNYITLVPYTEIQSLTFSDIDSDLPKEMKENAPLFQGKFSGQDQRWFQIMHGQTEHLLMLPKTPDAFLRALQAQTDQTIILSVDGMPRQLEDIAFRQSQIVQTITDRKGKPKTDDYNCTIILSDTGLTIKGKDKNFLAQMDVPYAQIQDLSYEHARQSSYMGRMPGFGAFRKPKHWFVIRNKDNTQIPLVFSADEVASFRESIEKRSNIAINTQVARIQPSQIAQATLPEPFEIHPTPTTQLTAAKTIRCTLGPGQRADWKSEALNRDHDARFGGQTPDILFENIDLSSQTAQMRQGDLSHKARVIASNNGITFITVADNQTQITSIFSQNGRLISIHSHHTGGNAPQAGQFYGIAEILK